MRKLVKVVKIQSVEPICGADMIELAKIDGWQCVVKKAQFVEGDKAVYFEYDSLLPLSDSRFSFLVGRNECELDGIKYSRIKTMKLKKTLSQGLLLPLSSVVQEVITWEMEKQHNQEADLATYLGVLKYEPKIPAQLAGSAKGSFPSFIRKTDQERVNNIGKEYDKAVANQERFEVTVKLDGSSMTAYCYAPEGQVGVCSRNLELKTDESNAENAFVKVFKEKLELSLTQFMQATGRSVAIQGELCGPGIQGNFEGLDKVQFFVYDIFDIDKQEYLLPTERKQRLVSYFGELDHVPIVGYNSLLPNSVEGCIEQAKGASGLNGKYREGLVYKSTTRNFTFKAISVEYLLKEK